MHFTYAKESLAIHRRALPSPPGTGRSVARIAPSRFLPIVQAKLRIGSRNGKYEQEADALAERVMRMPDNEHRGSLDATQHTNTSLQRLCRDCGKKQQDEVQGKGVAFDTEAIDDHVEFEVQALQGGGTQLPDSLRAFFESRFKHNFGAVRIHAASRAQRLARDVNARAFTLGRNIVLGSGEFSPETTAGKRLLAHELAHVVQQERAQPHIQRLAIKQKNLSKGTCGTYDVRWEFVLDNAATAAGFIVQQIDRDEWFEPCPAQGVPAPLRTYWEAWEVEVNRRRSPDTLANGFTNASAFDGQPGTSGMVSSTGTVKFFPVSTTGDLNSLWKAREGRWGCLFSPVGEVPEAGDAPSTYTKPTWWDQPSVEGPNQRSVSGSWNCCDADEAKHATDVKAHP